MSGIYCLTREEDHKWVIRLQSSMQVHFHLVIIVSCYGKHILIWQSSGTSFILFKKLKRTFWPSLQQFINNASLAITFMGLGFACFHLFGSYAKWSISEWVLFAVTTVNLFFIFYSNPFTVLGIRLRYKYINTRKILLCKSLIVLHDFMNFWCEICLYVYLYVMQYSKLLPFWQSGHLRSDFDFDVITYIIQF